MDEPDQLLHVAQLRRDRRDSAAALAALIEELEAQGETVVEAAGHYANDENLYVSAAKRADGNRPPTRTPTPA
jgi:ParB family chromosome partitioning protein